MHQILRVVDSVQEALKSAAHADPVFLSTAEKREALLGLVRLEAQLGEMRLRVEAVAGDVADQVGARDPAAVVVGAALDEPKHAHADLCLAQALERWEGVRSGLAEGRFTLAHARIITRTLADLPEDVPAEIIERAEDRLCELAAEFGPHELRRLASRILAVVAPELGDAADAAAIRRLEDQAVRKASLSIIPQGAGLTLIRCLVPDATGERLRTLLESFTQPRIAALEADGATRPRPRLLADAFAELLERVAADDLPAHGGDATTVVVTVSLDQLRAELGLAGLGESVISAHEARRLACTAAIIPVVLGGRGEILDLGRTRRLFSPAQRKALRLRDRRCRAEGCAVPATWCDAHHLRPWTQGGATDLQHGVLLCGHHHHRAHDPAYDMTKLTSGDYRFHRRR